MAHTDYYLVAYDIVQPKRRRKIAKEVYAYAIGGQKSALEVPMGLDEAYDLAQRLFKKCDVETDRIHLIKVESDPILIGKASTITYDEGAIII